MLCVIKYLTVGDPLGGGGESEKSAGDSAKFFTPINGYFATY